MSWEFDYKRAWTKRVEPDYRKLPKEVHEIVQDINKYCADLYQNKDLGMDWPTNFDLKTRLLALPEDVLDKSMDTVYYLGHWGSGAGLKKYPYIQEHGTYWKYQLYAKKAWIERYSISCSVPMARTWTEHYKDMKPEFYTHTEGTEYDNEELTYKYQELVKSNLIEVRRVDQVNYQPHPFMIGPQHFPKDGGMYINARQAPCAMKGCNLSYDEHKSDKALVVQVVRDCTGDELRAALLPLEAKLKADKIDGVVLQKSSVTISK